MFAGRKKIFCTVSFGTERLFWQKGSMRSLLAALTFAIGFGQSALADQCRLALVLALDVSGSVNETEYRQQLDGLAFALATDDVRAAILQDIGAPVELAVFEWSSRNHQFIVLPWTKLDSHGTIDRAAVKIRSYRKQRAGLKTALSTALLFAANLLSQKPNCWQHTIDVSGDGKNNIGPDISRTLRHPVFEGVGINALVVGDTTRPTKDREVTEEKQKLKAYFEGTVIRGPGAFAMVAHGYPDYARAMQKKLLREISAPILGDASPALPIRK